MSTSSSTRAGSEFCPLETMLWQPYIWGYSIFWGLVIATCDSWTIDANHCVQLQLRIFNLFFFGRMQSCGQTKLKHLALYQWSKAKYFEWCWILALDVDSQGICPPRAAAIALSHSWQVMSTDQFVLWKAQIQSQHVQCFEHRLAHP